MFAAKRSYSASGCRRQAADDCRLAACAPHRCALCNASEPITIWAMPKAKPKTATANIYAVMGSDEAEVKRVAADLAEKLKPVGAGDFGLEVIDGAADNAEQAAARIRSTIEALQTLPFFGGGKLVWLKNANFLGDDPKARSAAAGAALGELSARDDTGFRVEVTLL